jgi:hypothetical protein
MPTNVFDFLIVEENIYRSRTTINQPLKGINKTGRRCVD